ncbi:uncharacterized protein CTRU02_214500 [Colletotrichum truncatum]|uniref:Uncharacterized protein n=1 Tax=Colletotrichum truncatum TaxID=5467 RepID=A0ACC3YF07_COLTU
MPSYKDSDDYKTYKEGLLQGGKNHRMEDLPPFEFNEKMKHGKDEGIDSESLLKDFGIDSELRMDFLN